MISNKEIIPKVTIIWKTRGELACKRGLEGKEKNDKGKIGRKR